MAYFILLAVIIVLIFIVVFFRFKRELQNPALSQEERDLVLARRKSFVIRYVFSSVFGFFLLIHIVGLVLDNLNKKWLEDNKHIVEILLENDNHKHSKETESLFDEESMTTTESHQIVDSLLYSVWLTDEGNTHITLTRQQFLERPEKLFKAFPSAIVFKIFLPKEYVWEWNRSPLLGISVQGKEVDTQYNYGKDAWQHMDEIKNYYHSKRLNPTILKLVVNGENALSVYYEISYEDLFDRITDYYAELVFCHNGALAIAQVKGDGKHFRNDLRMFQKVSDDILSRIIIIDKDNFIDEQ